VKKCDNSKIHIISNFILSTSLLIMFDTLLLRPSLHCNTPLHFTTLYYISPNYTSLHFTTLHPTTLHRTILRHTLPNYTSLHFATLHPTTLHYTSQHFTQPHFTKLRYTSPHFTQLHLWPFLNRNWCKIEGTVRLHITYSKGYVKPTSPRGVKTQTGAIWKKLPFKI
jgi:hypothetical protein